MQIPTTDRSSVVMYAQIWCTGTDQLHTDTVQVGQLDEELLELRHRNR